MIQRVNLHPKPRPRFIEPMECTRVPKLPEGDDWVYEIKQDGYRVIRLVDGNSAMLYSMSGQDYSSEFRHITFALQSLRQGLTAALELSSVLLNTRVRQDSPLRAVGL
jgi:bifunctional non-homologous end joining protein LigD